MTEERLKAIGAPVKTDRLDVTEREAFQVYADAVNEHYGTVNQSTTTQASRSPATLSPASSRTSNG